jgi:hypothetical protein
MYHCALNKSSIAALDARLGFLIARKCFQLARYNTHVDRLNIALLE